MSEIKLSAHHDQVQTYYVEPHDTTTANEHI